MLLTVRRLASDVPIATISVPRSMPGIERGRASNASAMKTRPFDVVDRRMPKPAVEPEA
jgi:hypothetical protein